MDLLTFGTVILFERRQYIWLVSDVEEEKIHLALILDSEQTRMLRTADENNAKRNRFSLDSPAFAYVILKSEDFNGRAAHLFHSDEHTETTDGCDIQGELSPEDIQALKKRILSGVGLTQRLVALVKRLDGDV